MPLWFIYLISDFFYVIIFYLFPYRKKVVLKNLANSFPNLKQEELKKIRRKFYRYFVSLFAESIKNLYITEKNLRKRMVVKNPELLDKLYNEGKSVILLSSHYNNWEFLITSQNLLFKHKAIGIGAPLSNKFWDKKMTERRERFGMKVVHADTYKETLREMIAEPTATLVLGDQSPGKDENCYWTTFLNQPTAFFFGAEFMANEFDMPVVCAVIKKVKRGKYELELELLTDNPREEKYGFVTDAYIKNLEASIEKKPEFWLWSHKRWKKSIPENLLELKENHKSRFEKRFRS